MQPKAIAIAPPNTTNDIRGLMGKIAAKLRPAINVIKKTMPSNSVKLFLSPSISLTYNVALRAQKARPP